MHSPAKACRASGWGVLGGFNNRNLDAPEGMRDVSEGIQMVSTYLSYDLINRDMKTSISRVAQQGLIERQTKYYKENIGNVKSVDEFLNNYQLYSYAMDAFGLGEMTYAKAFMKKVLESDLNDQNSFANKLTDERYREFAASFNFTASTKTVQTEAQLDKMIGLYGTSISDLDNSLSEETRYYKAIIGSVTNVDQLLQNDRTRAYIFQVFSIDEKTYTYAHIRGLMTSDIADPDSYLNQKFGAAYNDAVEKLAMKGNIELHGQVTARITAIDTSLAGTDLTAEQRTALVAEKVTRQDQLTQLEAVLPPKSEWKQSSPQSRRSRRRCPTPSRNITRWHSLRPPSSSRTTARWPPAERRRLTMSK